MKNNLFYIDQKGKVKINAFREIPLYNKTVNYFPQNINFDN